MCRMADLGVACSQRPTQMDPDLPGAKRPSISGVAIQAPLRSAPISGALSTRPDATTSSSITSPGVAMIP